jgi:HAD superfamily hydrolase (TIGR01509 family)
MRGVERGWASMDALLNGVEAVIFDNDGTLVDSMPAHRLAWVAALAPAGLDFPPARFYALAGMPAAEIVALLAEEQGVGAVDVAAVMEAKSRAVEADGRMGSVEPVAAVVEVLAEARRRGIKVAVASGGQREDVVASLVSAGVLARDGAVGDVFDAVVTAEDVARGKPDPETFLLAAERMGVDPARCVGLEDADLGLQALLAACMRAVDVRAHPRYPMPVGIREGIFGGGNGGGGA